MAIRWMPVMDSSSENASRFVGGSRENANQSPRRCFGRSRSPFFLANEHHTAELPLRLMKVEGMS